MGPCSNPLSSPPRLPSPPPFTEVPISPIPLSPSLSESPVRPESNSGTRRIRPGTKSHHIAARPPLVPLSELESALQLQEHLASLLAATAYQRLETPPDGIEEYLWCYELTRRPTRDMHSLLVALFKDNCTASSCPEIRASEWHCLCALHDPLHLLSIHNTRVKHLASIFRRLYRIFAHARFQHRSVFWEFFRTVSGKYSLIPEDNLSLRPAVGGVKSKNSFCEVDSDEEEIDEFDRGELDEDENFPDRDESESDEEQAEGEEEGELEIENSIEGDEVQDDEFDLDIDDDHSVEEEGSGSSALTETRGNCKTLGIVVYAAFLSCLSASIVNSVALEEKRELAVDAQIVLLSDIGPKMEERASGSGPVIGLRELAKSWREWKNMITGAHSPESSEGHGNREVEEAEGLAIEKAFMCYRGDKVIGFIDVWRCEIVTPREGEPKEAVENDKPDDAAVAHLIVAGMPSTSTNSLYPFADPYKVGGTFDHLDPGHKPILTMTAFLLSPNTTEPSLMAGITGETPLINKKHSAHLGSWDSRAAEFVDFLRVITDLSKSPSKLLTSPSASTPETDITPRSITATIPDGEKELDALQVYKVDDIDNEWRVKMSSPDIRRKLEGGSTA
ncbi:hypothetical protein HOY82DRAFT_575894 [Tuber indicum]|nr:hypothetical protein HOY82DRAFT_575894 [Tuber indicum]